MAAIASARIANFGSNFGALVVYALGGHIVVAPGLAVGLGAFSGARLGARSALRAGAQLVAAADRDHELRDGAAARDLARRAAARL